LLAGSDLSRQERLAGGADGGQQPERGALVAAQQTALMDAVGGVAGGGWSTSRRCERRQPGEREPGAGWTRPAARAAAWDGGGQTASRRCRRIRIGGGQ